MASDLPPEVQASYSAIIDDILATSDLTTISAKRIRKGLQEKVDSDIGPQKEAITALIMQRFDKVNHTQPPPTVAPAPAPTANGIATHPKPKPDPRPDTSEPTSPVKRKAPPSPSEDEEDDSLSSAADTPSPAKKPKKAPKVKKEAEEETDEQLAKRLNAELNASTARSTRGGGATKRKPLAKKPAKTPKKKSKAKINSDDDSSVEAGSEKPERERKGGFHKEYALSEPLAALVGAPKLSRPQTVKKIWEHVKESELQDPSDKRQIRCDEALRAVFRQERVHMFTMNRLLKGHFYDVEELE